MKRIYLKTIGQWIMEKELWHLIPVHRILTGRSGLLQSGIDPVQQFSSQMNTEER